MINLGVALKKLPMPLVTIDYPLIKPIITFVRGSVWLNLRKNLLSLVDQVGVKLKGGETIDKRSENEASIPAALGKRVRGVDEDNERMPIRLWITILSYNFKLIF